MKILHFIAYMMLPISIINNGYTMNNISNDNNNKLEDTGCINPIFKLLNNNFIIKNPNYSDNNQMNKKQEDISISSLKNNIGAKYESLMLEILELSRLTYSSIDINIKKTMTLVNNIFENINHSNLNIVSLKRICDKYDVSNTIYNGIKDNDIIVEHKVIKIINELASKFHDIIIYRNKISSIDKNAKEIEDELKNKINELIKNNDKYKGVKFTLLARNDVMKRDVLQKKLKSMEIEHNDNIQKTLRLLKFNNNVNYENFINNALNSLQNTGNIITLYEILNNDKLINNNIASEVYNNILYKDLDHLDKIVTCLENILKIKNELKQVWNDLENNNNNKNKKQILKYEKSYVNLPYSNYFESEQNIETIKKHNRSNSVSKIFNIE